MTIVNKSARISSEAKVWTVGKLYALHKGNKFHYDRERLQRLLEDWPAYKAASYITLLVNGGSFKDLFQIAEIKPIVESLQQSMGPFSQNPEMVHENLKYFVKLVDEGYEYIVLDGQHRIDVISKYLEDKINLKPINVIQLTDEETNKSEFVEGLYSKLSDEVREYIRNIPIIVTTYQTGDLRELAQIFITSNDMMPMTAHERRILNYNPLNLWLTNYCNNDLNIKSMFSKIGGMTGEYDLMHKGDTLFFAEMLAYINNNTYEGYNHKVLDDILGPNPSSVKITNHDKELAYRIMKTMADGCVQMDAKKLGKFTKSSLYNLFYTISFLLQKGNNWSSNSTYGFDGKYAIDNEKMFVSWFFDKEYQRMNEKGTYIHFTIPGTNKNKKQVHEWSFRKHNADQKHSSKESFDGKGGSKYTFTDWARVRYLLADLSNDLTMLETSGIIRRVGSRTGTVTRDEVLVHSGVPLSQSHKYHVDEKLPVASGGYRDDDNVQVLPAKQNTLKSDRPSEVLVNG